MGRMTNTTITLTPRWCEPKDALSGTVILHTEVTAPRDLQHLRYIKLCCVETNKTVFCRIFGPGKSRSYNGIKPDQVKRSIFIDAHYQQRLGIPDTDIGIQEYSFKIKSVNVARYYLNAVSHHPDDSIRIGAFLGLTSLLISLFSIALSIVLAS